MRFALVVCLHFCILGMVGLVVDRSLAWRFVLQRFAPSLFLWFAFGCSVPFLPYGVPVLVVALGTRFEHGFGLTLHTHFLDRNCFVGHAFRAFACRFLLHGAHLHATFCMPPHMALTTAATWRHSLLGQDGTSGSADVPRL